MTYIFRYRRKFLWKSHIVMGHAYDGAQDKMVLFFANGSVREVARWRDCEARLGTDWVLAQKKSLEEQTGQTIPIRGVS